MPALNVDYDDGELQELREIARELGMPMKAFVKASTAEKIAHHRALKAGAAEFQRVFADPELASAIADAGIEDGPQSRAADRAA